jgi:hypothetical protein
MEAAKIPISMRFRILAFHWGLFSPFPASYAGYPPIANGSIFKAIKKALRSSDIKAVPPKTNRFFLPVSPFSKEKRAIFLPFGIKARILIALSPPALGVQPLRKGLN